MARCFADPGRADPKRTADLPEDGPGDDGHLHAAPEYPGHLPRGAGRPAAPNRTTVGPAADGTGPPTATDLPAASPTAAKGVPGDDPGSAGHLHAAVQHPALLRPGRSALRPLSHRGLRRLECG